MKIVNGLKKKKQNKRVCIILGDCLCKAVPQVPPGGVEFCIPCTLKRIRFLKEINYKTPCSWGCFFKWKKLVQFSSSWKLKCLDGVIVIPFDWSWTTWIIGRMENDTCSKPVCLGAAFWPVTLESARETQTGAAQPEIVCLGGLGRGVLSQPLCPALLFS